MRPRRVHRCPGNLRPEDRIRSGKIAAAPGEERSKVKSSASLCLRTAATPLCRYADADGWQKPAGPSLRELTDVYAHLKMFTWMMRRRCFFSRCDRGKAGDVFNGTGSTTVCGNWPSDRAAPKLPALIRRRRGGTIGPVPDGVCSIRKPAV